ncbi:MAG: hypothetical protein R2686_07085 [Candidatus Nanopelagicales bacterium]
MARNMYGATSADFTITSGGRVIPGTVLTIWDARTGGTQITDLLDVDSVACTTVTSAADGSVVYYGPNNDKTVHWADSGQGSRIAIRPVDITGDPPVLSIGTVTTGAAAANLTGTSESPVLNLTLPTAGANGVDTAAIQAQAVTSAKIADGTIVNADVNASAAIAVSKLAGHATSTTDNALVRFDSTAGNQQNSGVILDDSRNMTGVLSITDAAMATATLGSELGDGVNLTQNLTGLTIGQTYQVAAVSGTLTAATLDGAALTCNTNATSFVATATSHTVVGTAGTATAISVKLVTARNANVAALVAGARVSQQSSNTFVGTLPTNLTTGSNNSAVGYAAQISLTTGSYNSAVGRSAQYALTTGSNNSAVGYAAQISLTTGTYNSAVGGSAQYALTTGSHNSAVGGSAQYDLTTGSYNSAVGTNAGRAVTTGSYNLALGHNAGYSGTTATISGSVCIGTDSSGTGAQATDDNQIVLGTSTHNTLIAGSLEMTGSGTGIIVRSPDGTRYRLGVANGGTVSVAAA